MYKIASVLMSFFIVSCSLESSKCTKEDILQLTNAGFSKNEISGICDSNETQKANSNIESSSVSDEDVMSSSTETSMHNLSNSDTENAGSDLESEASKLYVKASNQVQSMKKNVGSYGEALKLHQSALSKIDRITSDYDASNMAVALISDQMKIAGLTLSELEQLESSLQTLANAEQGPLKCASSVVGTIKKEMLHLSSAGFSIKDMNEICNSVNSVISNPSSESVSVIRSPMTFDRNVDYEPITLELGEIHGNYTLKTSGQLIYNNEILYDHTILYQGLFPTVSFDYRIHLGHVSNNGLYQILYAGNEKGFQQMVIHFLKTGHISTPHPLLSAYAVGFGVWNTQSTRIAVVTGGEVPDLSVFKVDDESWTDFHFYENVEPNGVKGVFNQSKNNCGWLVIENLNWLSKDVLQGNISIIENPWVSPQTNCLKFIRKVIEVTVDTNTEKYTTTKQ